MHQKTVLYDAHVALGAKIIPFAGWEMPVRYTGDKEEHLAVRATAGMFDVSHMGEFILRGPKALALIQRITTNDAAALVPGKAQYSCMPNREGGIVDDVIVYHIAHEQYMLVVNASNIDKDWAWVEENNREIGAEILNVSSQTALIAVSGPKAEAIVQALTDHDLSTLGTYECVKLTYHGAEKTLIATTGYTGERTFEIFLYQEHAMRIWNDLLEAGRPLGLIPCGLGARDTLRMEMGYMLYGNDIDDTTSPLEAPLAWITKLAKGPFNASEILTGQKASGVSRKLVAFEMVERGIPRHGYELASQGEVVGVVTSGTMSPSLNIGIGMGYVPASLAAAGTELDVMIRDKPVKARVVKTPFLKR